jgi:TPR repeat protein
MQKILYFICFLAGVAFISSAQPSISHLDTNSDQSFNIPEPTNDVISNSRFGDVVVSTFNSDYIILLKTNGDSVPKLNIDNMSDDDLHHLIECRFIYDKLTKVMASGNNTGDTDAYAKKLHEVWVSQTNLAQKIRTRVEILDAMRGYNHATEVYLANAGEIHSTVETAQSLNQTADNAVANAANAKAVANAATDRFIDSFNQGDYNARPIDPNYSEKIGSFNSSALSGYAADNAYATAADNAENAQSQADSAAQIASRTQMSVSQANLTCSQAVQTLAQYGILPENSADDFEFPTLSVKCDIDAERIKNPDSKYPSFTSVTGYENRNNVNIVTDPPSLDEKTVQWLIKYADDGLDVPQFNLGLRYLEGRGVPKDYAKAIEYLKKSAAQGNNDAQDKLNELGEK